MSAEGLRSLLEALENDEAVNERFQKDPGAVVRGYELSPPEELAVYTADEDAVRRLLGSEAEVSGFVWGSMWSTRLRSAAYIAYTTYYSTSSLVPAAQYCFIGPC
jgi:hypothetical protein